MENEKKLKFFSYYTRSSCEKECLANSTLHQCGCVQFYMPRDQVTEICGVSDEKCYRNVENSFHEMKTECECLEPCSIMNYELDVLDMGFK